MFIPLTLSGFGGGEATHGFFATFSDINGFWYNFVYFIMIVAFTYFYTAITVRPTQMAEEMKRNNGFIPGVKPGKKTAEYLDAIMNRPARSSSASWLSFPRSHACSESARTSPSSSAAHRC